MIPSRRPLFSEPGSRKYIRAEPAQCTQSGNHDVTQQGKIRKYDEEEWEGRTKSTMEKSAREELKVRWRRVRGKNCKYDEEE